MPLNLNIRFFKKPPEKIQLPILTITNTEIQHVESLNFLGITIHQNLTWTKHVNYLCNNISKITGVMNKLKSINPDNILLLLYNE